MSEVLFYRFPSISLFLLVLWYLENAPKSKALCLPEAELFGGEVCDYMPIMK
jgi:hypothetical protein